MLPLSSLLEQINPLEKKDSPSELYLSLVISEKKVKSGIWSLSEEGGQVLSFGTTENWGGESAEELIVVADTSIAAAVSKLPEVSGKQPAKTILGLPENWVEGSSLKNEKSKILQNVCKKLLLRPSGFVVTSEAIAHYLKKEKGGLPSVILVALEDTEIIVSLVVQGKFLGSKLVGRSDNLALDLEEGLIRFNYKEALPSRIILLDGENLAEATQTLVSYPWVGPEGEKKLNFLQLPKVEVAPPTLEVTAVVLAGSRELIPKVEEESSPSIAVAEEKPLEEAPPVVESPADFGFVKNEDILAGVSSPESEILPEPVAEKEVVDQEEVLQRPKRERILPKALHVLVGVSSGVAGGIKKIGKPLRFVAYILPGRKIFLLLFSLISFLALIIGGLLILMKVEVKLLVYPQKIEKEFEFTVSSKVSAVDSEKMILPAEEVTVEISGEKVQNVTGRKTVGEKARGEVIIYNRTDQERTLPNQSVLKSPAGLKFLLTAEVKVASKTADLEKGVDKWGEAKAGIIASEIGAQYNLAANSVFNFETFPVSVFLVKNPSALAGGTSREIQAVSPEDKESLQKALFKELEEKSKIEIGNKISPNDQLLPDSLQLSGKTDRFNHEIGDEAETLSLEEKVVFSALYLREKDFNDLVEKLTGPLVQEGYQTKPSNERKSFEIKDKTKRIYVAKIYLELLPQIETEKIPSRLKLKTFSQGRDFLKNLPQVAQIEIAVKPQVFSKLPIFPGREKNINILIEGKQ